MYHLDDIFLYSLTISLNREGFLFFGFLIPPPQSRSSLAGVEAPTRLCSELVDFCVTVSISLPGFLSLTPSCCCMFFMLIGNFSSISGERGRPLGKAWSCRGGPVRGKTEKAGRFSALRTCSSSPASAPNSHGTGSAWLTLGPSPFLSRGGRYHCADRPDPVV